MAWQRPLLLAVIFCATASSSHAQIYRWGSWQYEVIPGTMGITPGPKIDLSNWNTDQFNLRKAVFSRMNLASANFQGSWLDGAMFDGAKLIGANLSGSSLTNADISAASLAGANLTGAVVAGANFYHAGGFTEGQLYSTASYQSKDLQGIGFFDNDLQGWDFHQQNLAGAKFGQSRLTDANLTGAIVTGASFWDVVSQGFTQAQLQSTASYQAKDLHGIVLGGDLTGWDFHDQNLTGASLGSSTLTGANLTGAVVTGAWFRDATTHGFTAAQLYSTQSYVSKDLRGIVLDSPNDLTGWDFHDQNLTGAGFSGSTLAGVNLTGAVVTQARLDDTTSQGFTAAQLYSTQSYANKDLSGIKLVHNNLTGWDFSGQNLTGANFESANLTNANLTGAVVRGASFVNTAGFFFQAEQLYSTQSYVAKDLREIEIDGNLSGWDLKQQNLINANFGSASLVNTNLTGADVRGAGSILLVGAILKNTIRPDGSVVGLHLGAGDSLTIRDCDAVGNPAPKPWMPERPAIAVKVRDQMTVTDGGQLQLIFGANEWDSIVSFQRAIPVQLGGTLELNFADDIQLAAQSGRTIKAFDWTGVKPQGQFTVAPQPGTTWDTSKLYTTGEVTLLGISSDLNGDKDVDSEDLLGFLKQWTGSDYPADDKSWHDGDSDHDGDVDSADMLVFLSQWTGAAASGALPAVSVPEPMGMGLTTVAMASFLTALFWRRRYR
ncbi:MAG: pentapeptide repeat-containing protein [Pirellulales bacterium]